MGIYTDIRDYFRNLVYLNRIQKKYETKLPSVKNFTAFSIETSIEPIVSIIIPFYQQYEYTYNCLKSIAKNSPKVAIEIILIDDNSNTSYDFSFLENIEILKNENNLGFLKSVNKGILAAKGKYIYLLNNDTEVHYDFLDELISVFDNFDNVGAVGSMLLNMDGTLQEAGSFFLSDKSPTQVANKKIYAPEINYVYKADYCSGCSLLFQRVNDHGDLNIFDEKFAPAYFEDADLCFQLKYIQEKDIYYTPFSKVTHFNGVSYNPKDQDNSLKSALFSKNHELFKQKWASPLSLIKADNKWKRIEELYGNKQILFLHERPPQYDNNSGELRLTEIIKTYVRLGYNCSLLAPKNSIKNSYNEYFQKLGVRIFYKYTVVADLHFFIRRFYNQTPLVWYSASEMCIKYHSFVRNKFPKAKTIFDMVDIHHLRYKRALEITPKNKKYKRRYKRYLKYEKKAAYLADIIIPISEDEKKYMEHFAPRTKLIVISNIHYTKVKLNEIASFDERKDLLFIGSSHHPNVDAIHFLKDEILPKVWQTNPNICLNIIGDVKSIFKGVQHPNINFLGYVPDITPLFLTHLMMVAPLRYGAGVKGKIGQAFEYYLPLVTSSTGAEGMFLKHNENALLADNATEFATQINRLLVDKALWSTLQQNAKESLKPFSTEALIDKINLINNS